MTPGRTGNRLLTIQAVVIGVVLLLPGAVPSLFGWVPGLLAAPVFGLLLLNGKQRGLLILRNGILLALGVSLAVGLLPSLLFTVTLVPLGFSFARSFRNGKDEIETGATGVVVLAVTWLLYWGAYGAAHDINPYRQLLEMLDTVFAQSLQYYREQGELSSEGLIRLEELGREVRAAIPMILPAMLCAVVLLTVWINLLLSNAVAGRLATGDIPWRRFSQWRLPDRLVWLLIASSVALFVGSGRLGPTVLALFFSTALLYFFQGLAVFVHLLDKWKVPVILRIVIYLILILQSYGLIVLTLVGLADVWFDFRRAQTNDNTNGE